MVTKEYVLVGRHVIQAVIVAVGRRLAGWIDAQDFAGYVESVETVRDEVDADRRNHQPSRVYRFAATQRNHTERNRAEKDDSSPQQLALNTGRNGSGGAHSFFSATYRGLVAPFSLKAV
jgi:hypothetical protein